MALGLLLLNVFHPSPSLKPWRQTAPLCLVLVSLAEWRRAIKGSRLIEAGRLPMMRSLAPLSLLSRDSRQIECLRCKWQTEGVYFDSWLYEAAARSFSSRSGNEPNGEQNKPSDSDLYSWRSPEVINSGTWLRALNLCCIVLDVSFHIVISLPDVTPGQFCLSEIVFVICSSWKTSMPNKYR